MSITPIKKPQKQVTRKTPELPPQPEAGTKTNLLLNADTVAALGRLKQMGYSKTFAIQRGVIMLENYLKAPEGRGI
ncbi:MAG: hypothetical protein WCJ07_08605 [Verrucomicrobiota bacterium]